METVSKMESAEERLKLLEARFGELPADVRLARLEEWVRWGGSVDPLGGIAEKLRPNGGGLLSITDEEIAACHLAEFRMKAGASPAAAAKALSALIALREKGWRVEWEKERLQNDVLERKIVELGTELKREKARFDQELTREKRRVEDETRRVVTKQLRAEAEMRARVKSGVDRLVGGSTTPSEAQAG